MPAAFMAKSAGLKAVAAAASAVSRASDVRAQWRRVLRYTKKVASGEGALRVTRSRVSCGAPVHPDARHADAQGAAGLLLQLRATKLCQLCGRG